MKNVNPTDSAVLRTQLKMARRILDDACDQLGDMSHVNHDLEKDHDDLLKLECDLGAIMKRLFGERH